MKEDNKYYEFIAKDLAGELTTMQQEWLYAFLDKNENCRNEYEKLKSLYLKSHYSKTDTELDQMFARLLATINESENEPDDIAQMNTGKVKYFWPKIAIAVALIGCVVFAFMLQNKQDVDKNSVASDQSIQKIILPDATTITLNAHSTLQWDSASFNKDNRTVYLEGEAYFDVSKNKKLPFIVKTKYSQIKVLGTAFNVKSFTNRGNNIHFETELLRGKIELSFTNRKEKFYLWPNDKVKVDDVVKLVGSSSAAVNKFRIAANEIKKDTSWIQNEFIWDNTPLYTIVTEIENRFNVTVTVEDPTLNDYKYSGNISAGSLDLVLKSLSMIRNFNYSIDNKKVIIKK